MLAHLFSAYKRTEKDFLFSVVEMYEIISYSYKDETSFFMNHLQIITTCFQNTLGSFLDRHLVIIKSLRKQKLDLAPNSQPSFPIPSTWNGNDIILSRGRGAAGLQNKLSIQLRSHTARLLVCEDFRRFCGGSRKNLRIPHTEMSYF